MENLKLYSAEPRPRFPPSKSHFKKEEFFYVNITNKIILNKCP